MMRDFLNYEREGNDARSHSGEALIFRVRFEEAFDPCEEIVLDFLWDECAALGEELLDQFFKVDFLKALTSDDLY